MSDSYWRPGATVGPEWVIPSSSDGPGIGSSAPADPRADRRTPSGATLAVLVCAIVVTLVVGLGSGVALQTREAPSPRLTRPGGATATAPATPSPSDPGIAVAALDLSAIAAKVDPSVVDISTTLGYQNGAAAGTGMVLTSSGQVLTNNHVIESATSLTAQVNGEGQNYAVKVLGSDSTHDVALIQLVGASGLTPVAVGDPSRVSVGDQVVAIGNALGRGGPPAVESGVVTGIDQSITAGDPATGTAEELTGLIQVDAALKPGDSGGPLVDMTGRVIGLDTAASVATRYRPASNAGFAIPIDSAMSIVAQIRAGVSTATVQIGQPAFLGVQVRFAGGFQSANGFVEPAGGGAVITGVIHDGPADGVGMAVGDVIASIDEKAIDTPSSLTSALRAHRPGETAVVGWIDQSGQQHTARVLLGEGPAS